MSTARTPALNQATKTVRLAYMGGWFSLTECEPKRPPRLQKPPLDPGPDSGTLNVATPTGSFSSVTSTTHILWRGSWHSLASDSFTTITKSRGAALSFANSASSMPRTGSELCAPFIEDRSNRPTWGASRFSGVGSRGPDSSFARSTICTMPSLLVP